VLQPQLIAEIASRTDGREILRQHGDIQCAVRQGQPARAEQAMRAHLEYLKRIQGEG